MNKMFIFTTVLFFSGCGMTQQHIDTVKRDYADGSYILGTFGVLVTPVVVFADIVSGGGTLTPEQSASVLSQGTAALSSGQSAASATLDASATVGQNGSCNTWSVEKQKQVGDMLLSKCKNVCAKYNTAAQAGGQRTLYESAACMETCYVNNLPEDCPDVPKLKQSAIENYNQARALGGCNDCPTIGRGGLPVLGTPTTSSQQNGIGIQDDDCIAKHSCVVAPAR